MSFFTLSNTDVNFLDWEFWWRTYINQKASFLTIRYIELVGKNEFIVIVFDPEYETLIIYITFLNSTYLINADIYLFCRPKIAGLIAKETLTKVSIKYVNFVDVFFLDLASKFFKYTGINNYAIELVNGQQPFYRPIHSLEPLKLETLKTYIKTNLANIFIQPFKSSLGTSIFVDRKLHEFF